MKVINNIIFSLLLLNFLPPIILSNEIDSIKTDEDVNIFVRERFASKFPHFTVADTNNILKNEVYKLIADTLGMKYWYKTDFNNDGETDLLAYGSVRRREYTGSEPLAVVYMGNDIYKYIDLRENVRRLGIMFPVIDTLNSEAIIIRYQTVESIRFKRIDSSPVEYQDQIFHSLANRENFYVYSDTLVYKFGSFVEYNKSPEKRDMLQIEIHNSCGMIACYVMNIKIKKDGTSTMLAGEYYEDKINYQTHIYEDELQKIFELINYIEFHKLKNGYSVGFTDASSVSTKVTYSDGKMKQIYDYGRSGTFGLIRLYQVLFDLKETKLWEVIE